MAEYDINQVTRYVLVRKETGATDTFVPDLAEFRRRDEAEKVLKALNARQMPDLTSHGAVGAELFERFMLEGEAEKALKGASVQGGVNEVHEEPCPVKDGQFVDALVKRVMGDTLLKAAVMTLHEIAQGKEDPAAHAHWVMGFLCREATRETDIQR